MSAIRPFPPRVLRADELPAIDRGGGARTVPLVTAEVGATSFLNGFTSFTPGSAIAHHQHNCVESVLVVEGDAVVDIDGVEARLRTGDVTFVPANIAHHFRNASETAPMRIFWTYASTDATRTVVETGTTGRVDAEQSASDATGEIVTEVVELVALPGAGDALESAVTTAAPLFQGARGCRSFELHRSEEQEDTYRLLIEWTTIEDHTVGFRESPAFARWRELVMPHLAAPPRAGHLRRVLKRF